MPVRKAALLPVVALAALPVDAQLCFVAARVHFRAGEIVRQTLDVFRKLLSKLFMSFRLRVKRLLPRHRVTRLTICR